jgi:hypothetical protein
VESKHITGGRQINPQILAAEESNMKKIEAKKIKLWIFFAL